MVDLREPKTLVRLGNYGCNLEDAVKNFHYELEKVASILGNTVQYWAFDSKEPYLLIVSQQKDKKINPETNHNVILTATSYLDAKNNEIADSFEKETGIALNLPVPDWFKNMYDMLNLSFKVFEKYPSNTMAFLMNLRK